MRSDLPIAPVERYNELWARIRCDIGEVAQREASEIWAEFLGPNVCVDGYGTTSLHHLAVYLGDYASEQQVEDWHRYLLEKRGGEIRSVDRGPSYVAPKLYGTPGWWFSVVRSDGFVLEMFCNRFYGAWSKLSASARRSLMSHKALLVSDEAMLQEMLRRFDLVENIELIAYTAGDAMGHTYGHLRNNLSCRVLELICIAQPSRLAGESRSHG